MASELSLTALLSRWQVRTGAHGRAKEDVTRESIATIRDDISELFTRVEEAEVRAAALPSRTKYLLLVHGFLRRLLDLHIEFVDDLERELAPDSKS